LSEFDTKVPNACGIRWGICSSCDFRN
jgi:hypothetical protein